MSAHTDRSNWSLEESSPLDKIDKEVQLVSTSSDSYTLSNHTKESNSIDNIKIISKCEREQSTINLKTSAKQSKKQKKSNAKLHSSCDDLSLWTNKNKTSFQTDNNKSSEELTVKAISRSSTFVNLNQNKKVSSRKYDHIQSKIKQYFNNATSKNESTPNKNTVITEIKETNKKDDYLEEINKQLVKELDEKNAIITLLQENYEHLLFKYAEAQNKLDELRLKFMTKNVDTKNFSIHSNFYKSHNQSSLCNIDCLNKKPENKCQKAVVAPFLKSNENSYRNPTINIEPPITRPSSLPIESNLQFVDRDVILTKATTPTDSEGLSSVITSMSGHSKILNSLDEETQINKKSNIIKHQNRNFILKENFDINDPFDKVKNWQNSLPPLEQIETPETTLYNVCPSHISVSNSDNKKYKDVSSPKIENEFDYLEESCPPSWREDHNDCYKNELNDADFKKTCISSVPVLSHFKNTSKRSVMCQTYKKTTHHSFDVWPPDEYENNFTNRGKNMQNNKDDVSSNKSNQSKHKRPPLLRCSSLPTYDCDSIKSGHRNGIYIPPLNLSNITLSDEESYCQQHYYLSKVSNSSFNTSGTISVDRSIQTSESFRLNIDEENYVSKVSTRKLSKSTSITPDKNSALNMLNPFKYNHSGLVSYKCNNSDPCTKQCCEFCKDKLKNWCKVCGEPIIDTEKELSFRTRSNSCESVRSQKRSNKLTSVRTKPPFKRSVSFNSELITSKHIEEPGTYYEKLYQENLENFDAYANTLKARSQAVMKALTAHVNKTQQS